MIKILKKITLAAMICIMASAAYAENDSNIYPLPAVFTSKNINNPKFDNLLKYENQNNTSFFVKIFMDKFQDKFPNVVNEISDKNKYNTFVAYINIARASENYFNKGKIVDVHLPMTLSLNFVNMATSEILYSESATKYQIFPATKDLVLSNTNSEKFNNAYKQNYEDLINEITEQAKNNFKPYSITINIIDKYKDLYVLDKGLSDGIAKGDLLSDNNNNQLSILYSDLDYAIGKSTFGSLKKDSSFTKYTTSSVMQLKKPKVLFINDFDNEKIYNLFATALGNNADFSLIPVNKSFYDMQTALVSLNSDFKNQNIQNRELPDYFFKLTFSKPLFAQYPTNKSYYNIHQYGMFVCGNILDKQGNIVYATCVNDDIKDEVVADIKFSDEAQYEVITKNTFAKLAEDIAKNVKFKKATIPIAKVKDNTIILKDNNHLLNYGDQVLVTKKVKTEQKETQIFIPTWNYKVVNIRGNQVDCEQVSSFADGLPNPSKKDIVQVNTISTGKIKTSAYNFDFTDSQIEDNQINLNYFDLISSNAVLSKINLPVAICEEQFNQQIDELNSGYGFKRKLTAKTAISENFITPKYKIMLISEKKKGNLLEQKYKVICGLVVKNKHSDAIKTGLSQEITLLVPPTNNKDVIEYELLKYMYPLLQSVAQNFNEKNK